MLLKLRTQPFSTSKDNTLPPRMFITPDLTSNGNDTPGRTFASNLTHLEPLLVDKTFMQNTLVLIPFDENETYSIENKVFGILLGDAVPKHLVGTSNNSFYNHDSEISTVSANWGIFTLDRWDAGASVQGLLKRRLLHRRSYQKVGG